MPPSFRSSVRWMKTDESREKGAWQRKEQDARRAGVDEGIRELAGKKTREMARVLHDFHMSGNVGEEPGMSRKSHDVRPIPVCLLGVESSHRGRILLIHLIHVRLI